MRTSLLSGISASSRIETPLHITRLQTSSLRPIQSLEMPISTTPWVIYLTTAGSTRSTGSCSSLNFTSQSRITEPGGTGYRKSCLKTEVLCLLGRLLLDVLIWSRRVGSTEMFEHVCKRNRFSHGFDFNPNPLSFLGLRNDYDEPTLYAGKTISLIS